MEQMLSYLLCTRNRQQGHASHNSILPLSPIFYQWPEFFTTAPSQQEENARKRESTRLSFRARIEEAYVALKVMVEEEERSRPRTDAEDTGFVVHGTNM